MIGSLPEYRAGEEELKGLLASFASAGDLVDAGKEGLSKDEADWEAVSKKITVLKEELKAYREAHPEDFKN